MFNYSDMSTETIIGMRFYKTHTGNVYPSITTILGDTQSEEKKESLKKWQNSLGIQQAKAKTQEAADRGTAVHLLAERYLKKETLILPNENFSSADVQCFNALKMKLNKVQEVWGQEVALCSDLLEIAGRCDCIGVYNNIPCIIDFKTSTRLKNEKQIEDYKLQLCAYAIMHNEQFGTDIVDGVILMTSAGGFPQEFRVNLLDYVDELIKRVDLFYVQLNKKLNSSPT